MQKLISIGMPVYNCSMFINDAILSIINQSYKEWELIIINDNSTDDTLEKIKKHNDSRIKVINNDLNKGLPSCLNECIAISKGEYFARMDGDDIMINDRLEIQIKFLENNPGIDLVGGLAYLIDKNNQIIGCRNSNPPENLEEIIKFQGLFIHPTVMGKTKWFIQNQYDENIKRCQDFELWLRTYQTSNFFVLKEFLLFYREVESIYKEKYHNVYLNLKKILNKHREKVSTSQYCISLSQSYLKYIFFEIFKFIGVLQPKQQLSMEKIEEIQQKLNRAIKQ